ncbi:hypothetical protein BDY24DRAFT_434166 [Mrakia frigida]|uniref:uncharacterized protein n=1 Tax=Mrakia frigida TaxID=29902 RepID=UPI003FCC073A
MGLFRKKSSHPPVVSLRPALPKTLSLPDLHDGGELSLPSRWLDSQTYKEKPSFSPVPPLQAWNGGSHQRTPSNSKMSFQTVRTGFHRPFRGGGGMATPGTATTSPTASSFQHMSRSMSGMGSSGRAHRKRQQPTTFNLGVVGGTATGKSSLLRLILQTLSLPPTTSPLVQAQVSSFGTSSSALANSRHDWTLSLEVDSPVNRGEKLLLTVVDTPGLPFGVGKELELDRGVSVLMKELEGRLGATMREESKVIRTTKEDNHIHLLIYLIDPISILQTAGLPLPTSTPPLTSSSTFPPAVPLLPSSLLSSSTSIPLSTDKSPNPSTMHLPTPQIKALTRLSTRTNLLPVLTKTDLLTRKQLERVREVVKRDLEAAGVDLGGGVLLLGDDDEEEDNDEDDASSNDEETRANDGRLVHGTPTTTTTPSKPKIIRLRSTRSSPKLNGNGNGKSFAGRQGRKVAPAPQPPSPTTSSMSGERVRKLALPLALVAPEEDDEGEEEVLEEGKGEGERKFVREYPWGTLHVLNPEHSDFVPFQQALFSSVEYVNLLLRLLHPTPHGTGFR